VRTAQPPPVGSVPQWLAEEVDRRAAASAALGFRGGSIPPGAAARLAGDGYTSGGVAAVLPFVDAPDLPAVALWAGVGVHAPLATTGTAEADYRAGQPATATTQGGTVMVGIAMHDAQAGETLDLLLGNGPPPPTVGLRDRMGSATWSGTEDRRRAGLPPKANVYERMLAGWRSIADSEQAKAGELPPSHAVEIARRRGKATGLYTAANELADVLEPLRTGEEHDDDPALD